MKVRCLAIVGSFLGLRQGLILGNNTLKGVSTVLKILPFKLES